ncbi:MAG TPA: restriction endonuclease subunit S [Nitrososphaeraceae archaeon]|nr:restriction endonuclease subunit S [Nitrososphaeraceae archaeon]
MIKGISHTKFKQTEIGDIPEEWKISTIGKECKVGTGRTPSRRNPEYFTGTIPWVKTSEVDFCFIKSTEEHITERALKESNARLYPKGTLLIAMYGQGITRGKSAILDIDAAVNQACAAILSPGNIYTPYLFYWCQLNYNRIRNIGQGSFQSNSNLEIIRSIKILVPPLEEQQKLASILSKIDNLIQKTVEVIEQTQRLKKSLMQSLLTRGINHTTFKKVNIGKKFLNITIPESWSVKKFGDVLKVRETFIDLDDSADYTRVTVRRKHEGVVVRDVVKGKDILTKNQYRVYGGDFIISRRQIIHNACGLVPKELDGAVVSNEYSCFTGTDYLDLDYMDWFSRTKLFQQTIIVTTHGGAIEKYVFLLEEWLKLLIPLPPLGEQRKIVTILSTLKNFRPCIFRP